jgi:integrase
MKTQTTLTVETAASAWLLHLETRKRRPAKPASLQTFRSHINRILPRLGNLEVGSIGVAILRDFISELAREGLSAKTQVEIAGTVKQVIASCTDAEGEPLFPRDWDNDLLDLPIVNPSEQHTPIVTREQIEQAIANSDEAYQCLYSCLAGSGLRVGEVLAIKLSEDGSSTVFDSSAAMIRVRRSLWHGREQAPKTPSSVRDVEIPRSLAAILTQFAGDRTGYLFGNGAPLKESEARENLAKQNLPPFHAFRRFFVSHRRSQGMPEEILRGLVGHASQGITDRYSRFGTDAAYAAQRREWVERVGLGFSLPHPREIK